MLVAPFLGGSLVVSFIAFFISLIFAWLVLPYFFTLFVSPLSFSFFANPWMVACAALALVAFVGIFAGAYPAFIISKFEPLQIFKPAAKSVFGHHNLRKILVGIQFIISIMLVAGTLLVHDQLDAIRSQ